VTTAASGDTNARPPSEQAASPSEATVRRTARVRPLLPVRVIEEGSGYPPDDPYVRRYWVAAIGPGAVAELLRLIRAGATGRRLPLPRWLPVLLRSDLVQVEEGTLVVSDRVPPVPPSLQRRFPPGLREEHRRAHQVSSRPDGVRPG
jgi:hypothetical protein